MTIKQYINNNNRPAGAEEDRMEKMLMNPKTGSVDSAENWAAEGYDEKNAELIEVCKDKEDWIEKE